MNEDIFVPTVNPLVSVIVPNYNYARFLKQRIDTILNQTYQNFELIILDDHSTDNSKEVIESYRSDPHISHIVYNKSNSGSTFKQWKKGLDLARGDLVWIAEADDYSEATFLESLVPVFEKYNNVGMAFCFSVVVDETGIVNSFSTETYNSNWKKEHFFNGKDFIKTNLSRGTSPQNVSSAIFSFRILKQIYKDSIYQDMKISGDRMFYILISEKSSIVYVNEKLNFFRCKKGSVTPTRMYDGSSMKENFIIDRYLRKKKLLTGWNSLLTWCNRFEAIYNSDFNSEQTRQELMCLYNPYGIMSRPLLKIISFISIKMVYCRKK